MYKETTKTFIYINKVYRKVTQKQIINRAVLNSLILIKLATTIKPQLKAVNLVN